jgi:Skp family chaperone for outer membrane proteins
MVDKNRQAASSGKPEGGTKSSVLILTTGTIAFVGCISLSIFLTQLFFVPRIAYLDTAKLLVGFSEAAKVDREVKVEDDKWQVEEKVLQDSLRAVITAMSKDYDRAPVAKKKEMQDALSARNQQINNFREANVKRVSDLRQKKMQTVFEKVNVFIGEYGKKKHYSMIFGTATGGSILFGDERGFDITEDIIKGLNERYK